MYVQESLMTNTEYGVCRRRGVQRIWRSARSGRHSRQARRTSRRARLHRASQPQAAPRARLQLQHLRPRQATGRHQ